VRSVLCFASLFARDACSLPCSVYLGSAIATALAPTLQGYLGSTVMLALSLCVFFGGATLILRQQAAWIKLPADGHSAIMALGRCVVASGYNFRRPVGVSASGDAHPSTWLDRCKGRVSDADWSLAYVVVVFSPFAWMLFGYHAAFGTLELPAFFHHVDSLARPTMVLFLGERQLQIVKAVYALVLVPLFEFAILPALWMTGERSAKPTPLRRAALGMFIGATTCFLSAILHILAGMNATLMGTILQVFRTALLVMSELLVGGAFVEFAYAVGVQKSTSSRISTTWLAYASSEFGMLASAILWQLLSWMRPAFFYTFCAACAVIFGILFVSRAWPLGHGPPGEDNVPQDSELPREAAVLPGIMPDDEHVPRPNVQLRLRKAGSGAQDQASLNFKL
jgi:hypothetical protein